MQRDIEALEIVCKHYDACYTSDALRKEKNRVRVLQRRLSKLESEKYPVKICEHDVSAGLPAMEG